MMRFLTPALLMLTCAIGAVAQPDHPPDTLWTRNVGTSGDEVAWAICNAWDGGMIIAGQRGTGSAGPFDFFVAHLDPNGTPLWVRQYGGTGSEIARAVQPTPDGNYILAGTTTSFGAQSQDIWVLKVSDTGDSLWARRYGSAELEEPMAMVLTNDGGFALAGNRSVPGASRDALLMKISADGDSLWAHSYGTPNLEWALAMAATTDGGFVLAGGADPTGASRQIYLARTDGSGNLLWARTYGGPMFDEAAAVQQTADGGFILSGSTQSISAGNLDAFLLRTNAAGDTSWWRAYGTAGLESAFAVAQATDGGFVAAGRANAVGGGAAQIYLVKATPAGVQQWTTQFGGGLQDVCYAMVKTSDGGFALTGYSDSFTAGQRDMYSIRLSGFSGVEGVVVDQTTGDPLQGARVSAVGSSIFGTTDLYGQYLIVLPPGPADLIVYGQCVERDTIRAVEVIQDSIISVNWQVGLPDGHVAQTSVNIVAQNHTSSSGPFTIRNYGPGRLDFSVVTRATDPGGDWLTAAPLSGSLETNQSVEILVTVHADTTDTGVYDYLGYADVHMNSCPDSLIHVVVTAVVVNGADDAAGLTPGEYSLNAYPNPFNPATRIAFTLVRAQELSLTVFDMLGREARILTQGSYPAGAHTVTFDAADLPSGIYLVRLDAADVQLVHKLLLLK